MTGGDHRVRGFAAYGRREINSVSYGQENKNFVSPCLCVHLILHIYLESIDYAFIQLDYDTFCKTDWFMGNIVFPLCLPVRQTAGGRLRCPDRWVKDDCRTGGRGHV